MRKLLIVLCLIGFAQMLVFGAADLIFPKIETFYWQSMFMLYVVYWGFFALINFLMILAVGFFCGVKEDDEYRVQYTRQYGGLKVGDVITPDQSWIEDHDWSDINALAKQVHAEKQTWKL